MRATTRTAARHRRTRSRVRALLTVLGLYVLILGAVALAVLTYRGGYGPLAGAEVAPAASVVSTVGHGSPAADAPDTSHVILADVVSDAMNECLADHGYDDELVPVAGTIAAQCVYTDADVSAVEDRA